MKVRELLHELIDADPDAQVWIDPPDDVSQRGINCSYREVLYVEYGQLEDIFLKPGPKRKHRSEEA